MTAFYLLDPMFTFYMTNYLLVIEWINDQIPPDEQNFEIKVPLAAGLNMTFRNSVICFCL